MTQNHLLWTRLAFKKLVALLCADPLTDPGSGEVQLSDLRQCDQCDQCGPTPLEGRTHNMEEAAVTNLGHPVPAVGFVSSGSRSS